MTKKRDISKALHIQANSMLFYIWVTWNTMETPSLLNTIISTNFILSIKEQIPRAREYRMRFNFTFILHLTINSCCASFQRVWVRVLIGYPCFVVYSSSWKPSFKLALSHLVLLSTSTTSSEVVVCNLTPNRLLYIPSWYLPNPIPLIHLKLYVR